MDMTRQSRDTLRAFPEWRVTQDCAMCDTSLGKYVAKQCVTPHSRKPFRAFRERCVTHCRAECMHLIRTTICLTSAIRAFSSCMQSIRPTIWWDEWDIGGAFHLSSHYAPHCEHLVGRFAGVEIK